MPDGQIGKLKETEVEQPGHWFVALSASVAGLSKEESKNCMSNFSTELQQVSRCRQGVRVANLVRELIIGIETVCDRRKPKYAMNRTILDKNFHKQLILRIYWQRKAMKHP